MKELGIDISGHGSKSIDEFAGQNFDCVLTVCDNAKENRPVFPGDAKRFHRTSGTLPACKVPKRSDSPYSVVCGMKSEPI
jgi:protein-tyrosine-phosphatase